MTMRRMTKKAMALVLHAEGATVEEIARQLDTRPSYVANVLAAAGHKPAYHDLYVSTQIQSGYAPQERGLLRFKDVHILTDLVVERAPTHRKPPEVRICKLSIQS